MIKNNNNKIVLNNTIAPWKNTSKLALMVGTGLFVSGCASLQGTDDLASTQLSNQLLKKIDERDQKIAERDKTIDDLMHRVQMLEQHGIAAAPKVNQQPVNNSVAVAQTTPPANQPPMQKKPSSQAGKPGGAGSFEVDEDAAQRALERTLVQTGALLLPFGQAEIQPYGTYVRHEDKLTSGFLNTKSNVFLNTSVRKNEFDMGANLLVGLPFEFQAEFRVPYKFVDQSVVTPEGENSKTGNSLGDISVGLAKTVIHESNWIPDLIARLTWDSASGSMTNNGVAMGGGFNDFTASLTALKRQDPLAFTARAAYQKTLKKNDIEPGDQFIFAIGATLAASPQTSLSIGLQQIFAQESKINNVTIQGSDNVQSAFTVSASSTIGRRLFFSMTGGIGLTDTSPAYFLNLTIPFRFDLPL